MVGNVAIKVPFIINLKDNVAQTAWTLVVLSFERANAKTIAQKEPLIE